MKRIAAVHPITSDRPDRPRQEARKRVFLKNIGVRVAHVGTTSTGYNNLGGSIVPANLGVNPSLTIAALAEYAMSQVPKSLTPTLS